MRQNLLFRIFVFAAFLLNSLGPLPFARADELSLPVPGVLVSTSPDFRPALVQGLKIDPQNPFHLKFIMEQGQSPWSNGEDLRILRYFLTGLTVPEKDIWVNLSPHEKNHIIPGVLADTEMGVDLLGQDYLLKELASSLLYPEGRDGKAFWQRVYRRALAQLGTTNVPLDVINKVWITPGEISVEEKGNAAIINKATLQVMAESDYLALKKSGKERVDLKGPQSVVNEVYRKAVIPELTREVNQGAYFGRVRQIYHALILGVWYKRHFHQGALANFYVDLKKTAGISIEDRGRYGKIYAMYLKAYKKGVFNYVREEEGPQGLSVARKYFSGGFDAAQITAHFHTAPLQEQGLPSFAGPLRSIDVHLRQAQASREYIVDKTKRELLKEMGNKGRNQVEMEDVLNGHVPSFEILSSRLYDDSLSGRADIRDVARMVYEQFGDHLRKGGSLAVRASSAVNMPGILPTDKKVTTVDQIVETILKIYNAWDSREAQEYLNTKEAGEMFEALVKKNIFKDPEEVRRTPPAIVIQKEVFGDLNDQSASGVFISRSTSTGEFLLSGSLGIKTAPENIRNGSKNVVLKPINPDTDALFSTFQKDGNGLYGVLKNMAYELERHYEHPVEVEFVVQNDKLYVIQVNRQDIPENLRLAVATSMADQGIIPRTAIPFPDRRLIRNIGRVKSNAHVEPLAQGLGLSAGAEEGYLAFSPDMVRQLRGQRRKVIFVAADVNEPGLLQLLVSNGIDGLITFYGDYHMHTARIAREANIPAISLANQNARLTGRHTLAIGDQSIREGGRIILDVANGQNLHGSMVHRGELKLPLQLDPVVENIAQVSVGNLYFNVGQLQKQIMERYKSVDYKVLTGAHALLKAYLQKNLVMGREANRLEAATNAIHRILDQEYTNIQEKTRQSPGSGTREDIYRPIAEGFGVHFPFPQIKTVADIPKAIELMEKFVERYENMPAQSVNYLNYPANVPIIIPFNGDVPLEFSIIPSTNDVNWQYENPPLWAFVQGIEVAVSPVKGYERYAVPAQLVADPVSSEKIRVLGRLNSRMLPEIEKNGETYVRIGIFDDSSYHRFLNFEHDYHVQIKDFEEYMRHKIFQLTAENKSLGAGQVIPPSKIREYLATPSMGLQIDNMRGLISGQERELMDHGGLFWRGLKQTGSYTQGKESNLNPATFWTQESGFLVKLLQQLFPGIKVFPEEKNLTDVPSALQGHNQPTMYVETHASYIIFDRDAVEKLSEAISSLSGRYDLSVMFTDNERGKRLNLEEVILRLFIDRYGQEALVKSIADKAQVGGIDLNLSNRKIGPEAQGEVSSPWGDTPGDSIKGLVPVITSQKNISTLMEFIRS